jgi:hypothetical protein
VLPLIDGSASASAATSGGSIRPLFHRSQSVADGASEI